MKVGLETCSIRGTHPADGGLIVGAADTSILHHYFES
jgi:hypothetical protein